MSYEPIIKEETPPVPAAPDPMAAVNQKLSDLERQITDAYRINKGMAAQPQVQYVPYPVAPEPQAPAFPTEAEILADLPTAITSMAERIASEREMQLRQELGTHLSALYEKDFDRDFTALKAHQHFKAVEEELAAHFAANPNEKVSPGRLKQKFHELVGAKLADEQVSMGQAPLERPRAIEQAIPISTSALPSASPKREKVELDENREGIRNYFNQQFGLKMSSEEWAEIESRKLLEGTRD